MAFKLPTANKGGDAPEVDDGLALVRFDDLELKEHPDWAGTDNFGKEDSGERYHFMATLLDEDGDAVYNEAGDPVELEAMTRLATGEKSNFAAHMKGILTKTEFAAWQADEPFDASKVPGRVLQVNVAHNKKGWPFIETFLGQPKAKAKGKSKTQAEDDDE